VTRPRPAVAVFGANDPRPGDEAYELARGVGRKLAELGRVVVNGGYGGTMEASARGAKEAGGATVGVTCGVWRSRANEFIDEAIVTSSLPERIGKLIELGTGGYVVLPGATGTLAEFAWVWELASKGLLGGPARPIVCMTDFWRPLVEMMVAQRPASADHIAFAAAPAELVSTFGGR